MSEEASDSEIQPANLEEKQEEEDCVIAAQTNEPESETGSELTFASGVPSTSPAVSGKLYFAKNGEKSPVVCITAVPGLMTAPDFCQFVLPYAGVVRRVRLIRRVGECNRYVAIMDFGSVEDAGNFCEAYEGREFLGGLIKERYRLRMVERIEFLGEGAGKKYPYGEMFVEMEHEGDGACAVCLEKMEKEDVGVITTICHHAMHLKCLSKWDLNTCPVCRYRHELAPEASLCMSCNSPKDIWMCLVCGNVACGRRNGQHAHEHFEKTNHPFATNLADTVFWSGDKVKAGSVWDYISERFVNRLLSSEDGKVVEVAQHHPHRELDQCGSSGPSAVDDFEEAEDRQVQAAVYASRLDAMIAEYRITIESLRSTHATEMRRTSDRMDELEAQNASMASELEAVRQKLAAALKEKKSLTKKLGDTRKHQEQHAEKFSFLKKMNETLLRDKSGWERKVETLEDTVKKEREEKVALEEQLRDMMLHMEMQRRIDGAPGCGTEVSGGAVLGVGASPKERIRRMRGRG